MSLKNCFHVSTVANSRSGTVVQYYSQHPSSTKVKIHTPKCKSPRHHPSSSFIRRSPTSRIVCKAREAVDEVQVATETNWDNTVLASERPVLVEFWAPWCGPCRMIAPVVDELAKEYAGKVLCYKLNTDDCPNIATKYGIRSIPTVLFFKSGERKESIIGAVPKSTLTATIEKYLEI